MKTYNIFFEFVERADGRLPDHLAFVKVEDENGDIVRRLSFSNEDEEDEFGYRILTLSWDPEE